MTQKDSITVKQIEILEDLPLDGTEKWYTLLAMTGQKKASWLTLYSDPWREGDTPLKIPKERIDNVCSKLDELGLFYELSHRDTDAGLWQPSEESEKRKRYNEICDIFIGHTEADAKTLAGAYEKWDHHAIGLALGYPPTAVAVFGTDKAIGPQTVSGRKIDKEVLECAQFMVSKDNYKAELEVVAEWLEALKGLDSTIYNEI